MGQLDQFDAPTEGQTDLRFLSAKDVTDGMLAEVMGFGSAKLDGQTKVTVRLRSERFDRELVLNRRNGRTLRAWRDREGGDESRLIGRKVTLRIEAVDFRGKDVPSIVVQP